MAQFRIQVGDSWITIMDAESAADVLRISKATVQKQIKNGKLQAFLLGGAYVTTDVWVRDYRDNILGKSGRRRAEK